MKSTTEYRSAFSESTLFREILLIAEKNSDLKKGAVFSLLKVLPTAQNIDGMTKALSAASNNEDLTLLRSFGEASVISRAALARIDDWFGFIPGERQKITEDLGDLESLAPLGSVVPTMIQGLRLNRNEPEMQPDNALLSHEREERTIIDWKILHETNGKITAINVKRAAEVTVPTTAVLPCTRTASYMDKILIDRAYDYVVIDRFDGDETFWDNAQPDLFLPARKRQIAVRSAHLIMAGRNNIDLTASGTRLLAFASSTPIAPTWSFWALRTSSFDEACMLALWLNSTFTLNQLLGIRTEVRGSRVWFGKESLLSLPVLNSAKLTEKKTMHLLKIFNEIAEVSFPSLLDQLKNNFEGRIRIDTAVAEAVDFVDYQNVDSLEELYASTARRLEKLKSMMRRDKP